TVLAAELPGRDVRELFVVAQSLAVLGLRLGAEVTATRLATVEGVDAHEFTELDEVSHAAGLLQALVEGVGRAEDLQVAPELLLQLLDETDGLLEPLRVAVHAAVLPHDPTELLVEGVGRAGAADGEELVDALVDLGLGGDDGRVRLVDLVERAIGEVVADGVRQHEVTVSEALHQR